jgi:hypothetical protein
MVLAWGCYGQNLRMHPNGFLLGWPQDVTDNVRLFSNRMGNTTNSDLKMAGVLILWLVIEVVCQPLQKKQVSLFSDNLPTVGWIKRLASCKLLVAEHFVQALALQIKAKKTCPLTTLYIEGKLNWISGVPSRSFGSTPAWHCTSDESFLTLFNLLFPLPTQNSWTGFQLNSKVVMRLISTLWMKNSYLGGWRRLPKIGSHVGTTGAMRPTSGSGPISTDYVPPLDYAAGASWDMRHTSGLNTLVKESKFKLAQSLVQSQPSARRLLLDTNTNPTKLIGSKQFIIVFKNSLTGIVLQTHPLRRNCPSRQMCPNSCLSLAMAPVVQLWGRPLVISL